MLLYQKASKRENPSLTPPAEVFYLFVMTPHTTTSLQLVPKVGRVSPKNW
ncbi:unnamed protein product [marine sediment metagenome]|uniref:Uncharacterized protein n=1 Tax=marine sediment metagenome TaxID=412755 RepID=X1VWL4_9ZZZZ